MINTGKSQYLVKLQEGDEVIGIAEFMTQPRQHVPPFEGCPWPRPWTVYCRAMSREDLRGKTLTMVLPNGEKMENCQLISFESGYIRPNETMEGRSYCYDNAQFQSTGPAKEGS